MRRRTRKKLKITAGFLAVPLIGAGAYLGVDYVMDQRQPPAADEQAADYVNNWSPPPEVERPGIAIVGDSFAVDEKANAWPRRTARCAGYALTLNGALGTGFWNDGDEQQAYWHPDRVAAATANDPELIILESSYNDSWRAESHRDEVQAAITQGVKAYKAAAPDAQIVLVGPIWAKPPLGPGVPNNIAALESVAEAAGVTYINAVDWLPTLDYTTKDGMHPNEAGNVLLASKLLVALEEREMIESTGGCENIL